MNVLMWHVHGSWTTSFVQGPWTTLLPLVPERDARGRGRAATWDWPQHARECTPDELAETPIDVIVVQSADQIDLADGWLGADRRRRIPLVWLEHNAPQGRIADMRHPAADREDVTTVVHVTRTNALFWDNGDVAVTVIDHGVADPGPAWSGEIERGVVVVNEPVRRGRVVGTDLLERFGGRIGVDVFGMGTHALAASLRDARWLHTDDLDQHHLHVAMAERRCYIHPFRWTSLGLSLVEAMLLGMPIVALATTEVPDAVPAGCGVVTNDVDRLVTTARWWIDDIDAARAYGAAARAHALERFSLDRFLEEWNALLSTLA